MTYILYLLLAISISMIIISFLMSPFSQNSLGSLVGSYDLDMFEVSKEKGYRKFLKYSMFLLGFLLILLSIILISIQ